MILKRIFIVMIVLGVLGLGYFTFLGKENGDKTVQKEENLAQDSSNKEAPKSESEKKDVTDNPSEPRIIKIQAKKFEFSEQIINIKKGEKVKIVVENLDIDHGIMIPELVFPPTQKSFMEIDLAVDKPGEYRFFCSNEICGQGHGKMVGKIVVS